MNQFEAKNISMECSDYDGENVFGVRFLASEESPIKTSEKAITQSDVKGNFHG